MESQGCIAHADFSTCKLMATCMGIILSEPKMHGEACALAEEKTKVVPKTTANKSNMLGGRLFLDVSGP
jgi:hypothetical protein